MNKENLKDQNHETNVTEQKKETWNSVSLEIAKRLKAAEKAKNIAIVVLGIAVIVISIGLSTINYKNDCDWRKLFSEYDYVSQDGGGQNYYNNDVKGNVNNGAKNKEAEK